MNTRAYRSKIGQLPFDFRHELNNRIRDGRTGQELVDWINASPEFKALRKRIRCGDVNAQNLSDWRGTGYRDWLINQDKAAHIRSMSEYARTVVAEAGGDPASVGTAILTDKLLTILAEADAPTDALVKAVVSLRDSSTAAKRVKLQQDQLALREQQFSLERKKYQRQTCELFIKWFNNRKIKEIITDRSADADAKTEALGRELFGELWD